MRTQGRVAELRSFPVKSVDSVAVPSADVVAGGLVGDRAWCVVGPDDEVLTTRRVPALLQVRASAGPDGPELHLPGRPATVAGDEADSALSDFLGLPVRIRSAGGTGHKIAPIHLVSRQAVAASIGTTSDDPACDAAAPRANITLDLDAQGAPGLERDCVGREVEVGAVVLRVTELPKHCLGVYAEVVRPGTINLGDAVQPRR